MFLKKKSQNLFKKPLPKNTNKVERFASIVEVKSEPVIEEKKEVVVNEQPVVITTKKKSAATKKEDKTDVAE